MADIQAPLIPCRICGLSGIDKRIKPTGMNGHLAAHTKAGWTKQSYIEKFGPESAKDFSDYKPAPEAIAVSSQRMHQILDDQKVARQAELGFSEDALLTLADPNLDMLTEEEADFYEQRTAILLQAVDRDEVQISVVQSLVIDEIVLRRLRRVQLTFFDKNKKLVLPSEDLEKAITAAEKRIQTSMKSLSISREALTKNRESIKSTCAGLISGYLDEIARNTVDALDALMTDEKRVIARSNERLQLIVMQYAREITEEEETEDSDDTGTIFSFNDAVERADIAF